MKYSLLIIDDESQRNSAYRELLSDEFDLEIQNDIVSQDLQNAINDSKVDCIILDMVLSKAPNPDKEHFDMVMDMIGSKKPVVLISRSFNKIASWISNQRERPNIIAFIGWDELYTETYQIKDVSTAASFRLRIKLALNKYFHRSNSEKEPNSSIVLVHFSDFQFGDPNYAPDAKLLNDRILAIKLIQDYKLKIDFIIASGDIAYTGLPSEFEKGYEWLYDFAVLVLPQNFKNIGERILLCPGNHDVNLSLNAADYFTYNFRASSTTPTPDTFLKKRESPINDHTQFGLLPFTQFAYRLTGDINWIENPYGNCFINDRFIGWGIRFIHINTVMELGYLTPKQISVIADKVKNLAKSSRPVQDHLFTLIIAHNGPEDMGYIFGSDVPQAAGDLFGLINAVGGDLYLHGHRHKTERLRTISYEGKFTTKMRYGMSGTISLNQGLQPSDSRRSFSVIELFRKDSIVTNYEVKIFEIEGQDFHEATHKKSEVDLTKQ